ncbi:hypothetical protein NP233_g2273 [Leucocoprinus birnbaumii]|uniref:Uncharacterized protein n=1 Tax=Leucocoprinus birnbaumii TaxID=56174 RepID=A0AAD5W0L9_9AGAR|nr:hypothetical protein NP233_g2273 [Leucocoprinus birnbaumii]
MSQAKEETPPETPELKEAYFVTQVSVGELLATQGPEFHLAASIAFFKALLVYPSQIDLVMIYQRHVPEPVFKARSLSDVILRHAQPTPARYGSHVPRRTAVSGFLEHSYPPVEPRGCRPPASAKVYLSCPCTAQRCHRSRRAHGCLTKSADPSPRTT